MADSPDDLSVPQPDAGVAFRLEMWATNALLGYWWVLVAAVVAVLAGVLIYGFWDNSVTEAERAASRKVDDVMMALRTELIDPDAVLKYEQVQGSDGQPFRWGHVILTLSYTDEQAPSRSYIPLEAALDRFKRDGVEAAPVLVEAGDRLMAIHAGEGGISGYQAALYAAELYRLGDNPDAEQKALESAANAPVPEIAYPAASRLAVRTADAGDIAAAEATLRPWTDEEKGWWAQQATYDLGRIYQAAGRASDAEATYRDLLNTWQATPLRDAIDARVEEMGVDSVPLEPAEGEAAEGDAPPGDEPEGGAASGDDAEPGTTPDAGAEGEGSE